MITSTSLSSAFELYKKSLLGALPYSFITSLLIFLPKFAFISILFWIGAIIIMSALVFRLYCIANHIPHDGTLCLKQAFTTLIPLLFVLILYTLIVLSGTMLLVLPGIIFSFSLLFSFILVITSHTSVLQALITSHRLVWGKWWHIALHISFPFTINLIIIALALLLFIGLYLHQIISFSALHYFILISNIVIQTLFIPFIFSLALVLLQSFYKIK